ncbi:replication protein A 70 kDa DNA-binding subunit E-like [Tripterygium wilfordii]|uniref:replication protein A 70 kDa DNA-binding subunit E-like n=1 Tax=Tripterygium wilfordii TaxID=458696 RepID=UPI0018F8262E|nr:replication protein A 70 kDa DNA-binding subunit E-like [Tripterygium wilfordii]
MASTKLTEGAVGALGGGATAEDFKPMMQVTDLKQVQTKQQQATERFRVLLSDGSQLQQGMLATHLNNLVHSQKLQRGSIVTLNDYSCSVIQGRLIVIIMNLDVVVESSELIGQPVATPRTSGPVQSTDRAGTVIGNPQPLGGSSLPGGLVDKANVVGASLEQPVTNQLNSSSFSNTSASGRNIATNVLPSYPKVDVTTNVPPSYPKVEVGGSFSGSSSLSGSYSDQNMSFRNPRPEISRPPLGSYSHPSYPGYQAPSMYSNRGPIVKNEAPRIIPIAALNPYQSKWTIKARVTTKGELRHYNNTRGDGKVFSFDLLDSDGGEIRVTCFNAVADQFYHQIEAGKVYLLSKGILKPAQKNFNHLRNDLEISLDSTSVIQPCFEDDKSIPQQQFHFCTISGIEKMENNSIVDVIGVVSFITPTASIMRKNGTETSKRTLRIMDMSGRSVDLTLWGNFCNAEGSRLQDLCDSGAFPILAVKSGRISDFNGKAVGTIFTSQLLIEPDFPEARKLKEWFDKEGRNTQCLSISREISSLGRTDVRKTICQIKDENLGTSEKPDWITITATVIFIKCDNFCYTACPIKNGDRVCSKKVTNNGDGKWWCDRCEQSVDECDYRYILQLQIQDHTGITWVTAFQECGEELLGTSAKDLYHLKFENQDDENFSKIIRRVMFTKYIFKLKVKEETFSDESRVKSTVVRAEKMNYSSESRFLLESMTKLNAGDSGAFSVKAESKGLDPGMSDPGTGTALNRQTGPQAPSHTRNSYIAGREFGSPAKQVSQYGNQYSSSLPTTGSSAYCHSCGGTGHFSTNCPSIMSEPEQPIGAGYVNRVSPGAGVGGASGECFKCHKSGHWARDCPGLSNISPSEPEQPIGAGYVNRVSPGAGVGGASGECFKCHKTGHWARDCPGLSNIPPAYGSSGISPGKYGGFPKQHVGGF